MKNVYILISLFISFLHCNAQNYMYGVTSEGGANNLGTIFRLDENGENFEKVFDFTSESGGNPSGGLTLHNGLLYGFTETEGKVVNSGARYSFGTFFSFNPKTYELKVITYIDDKTNFGNFITQAPLVGSNGLFYIVSTSSDGLEQNPGKLFSYDPTTNVFDILATMNPISSGGIGGSVESQLVESNNKIYMLTKDGGTNGMGSIVTYDLTTKNIDVIHQSSASQYIGARNNALNIVGSKIYATSIGGGTNDVGIFFSLDLNGSNYHKITDFFLNVTGEGLTPVGGFIEDNGYLYGTTASQFQYTELGSIYKYNIQTSTFDFIKLLDKTAINPSGTFVKSPNGSFYLTCSGKSVDKNQIETNNGAIIEYNPTTNIQTLKHSFATIDGYRPLRDKLAIVDISSVTNSLSSSENSNENIKFYPNPTKNTLNISAENVSMIEIMSTSGNALEKMESSNSIDVSNLNSGMYLVRVTYKNGVYTSKFIKE